MTSHRRATGFTLIEQMLVLAISALLLIMALPSLAQLLSRTATGVTSNDLYTAAQLARTTAIERNTTVVLCPSPHGGRCRPGSSWQSGWAVALAPASEPVASRRIIALGKPQEHVHIDATRNQVRFHPDGTAAGSNLTFRICPVNAHQGSGRLLVISNVGRIREAPAESGAHNPCRQAAP